MPVWKCLNILVVKKTNRNVWCWAFVWLLSVTATVTVMVIYKLLDIVMEGGFCGASVMLGLLSSLKLHSLK